MKIGIDISQVAYENTGVAEYIGNLVEGLLKIDNNNEYIFFFSSLRKNFKFSILNFQSNPNVSIKKFKFPPILLDLLWNRLHIFHRTGHNLRQRLKKQQFFMTWLFINSRKKRIKKLLKLKKGDLNGLKKSVILFSVSLRRQKKTQLKY